jgi:predicted RNA-binding protein with TRAM domain
MGPKKLQHYAKEERFMKNRAFLTGIFSAALVFGLVLSGCNPEPDPDGDGNPDRVSPPTTYTTLSDNTWAVGDIITEGGEQWFMFTATAGTQYIHAEFGTIGTYSGLYIQLYNSDGVSVSSRTRLDNYTRSISQPVTIGNVYYVKIQAYYASDTGTFKNGFNIYGDWTPGSFPPANPIALAAGTWANGDITTAGGDQWFTFTATASPQYIHATFGTLPGGFWSAEGLYIQLFSSAGVSVSSRAQLHGSTNYISYPVTSGTTYLVRVQAVSSSKTGTYGIAFNTSDTPPSP